MEIEATKSEKAKSFQEDVLSLQRQSEKLKSAMDEMVRINGAAKDTDDYVALQSELKKTIRFCNEFQTNMKQSKSFIQNMALEQMFLVKWTEN
jgi:hypothetical protein